MRALYSFLWLGLASAGIAQTMPPSVRFDSSGRFAGTYRCSPTAVVGIEIDPETRRFVPRIFTNQGDNLMLHVVSAGIEDFPAQTFAPTGGPEGADESRGSAVRYDVVIDRPLLPEFSCNRDEGFQGRFPQTGVISCENFLYRHQFDLNSMTYYADFMYPGIVIRGRSFSGIGTPSYAMAGECVRESDEPFSARD